MPMLLVLLLVALLFLALSWGALWLGCRPLPAERRRAGRITAAALLLPAVGLVAWTVGASMLEVLAGPVFWLLASWVVIRLLFRATAPRSALILGASAVGQGVGLLLAVYLVLGGPSFVSSTRAKRTLAGMYSVHTAIVDAWSGEDVAAASPPEAPEVDVSAVPEVDARRLQERLTPQYIRAVPAVDAWGHPVEYRVDEVSGRVIIRSPGANGRFEGAVYRRGTFRGWLARDDDIVVVDGVAWRSPS